MKTIYALTLVISSIGCTSTGQPTPQTVAVAGPSINLAICIVDNAIQDNAAGMAAPLIVVDLINKCGTDATTVATVLAENKKLADTKTDVSAIISEAKKSAK